MTRHQHYQPPAEPALDLFASSLESPPGPPPPSHHEAPRTERLAADKIQPLTGTIRRAVVALALRARAAGITGGEACAAMPERQDYSVRNRLSELTKPEWGALLIRTTRTRPNHRGNEEMVYVHRDYAP